MTLTNRLSTTRQRRSSECSTRVSIGDIITHVTADTSTGPRYDLGFQTRVIDSAKNAEAAGIATVTVTGELDLGAAAARLITACPYSVQAPTYDPVI